MTEQNQVQDQNPSDKELNFRQLQQKHEQQLSQERAARMHAEEQYRQLSQQKQEMEEDDDQPYVDHKRLSKKLKGFEEQTKQYTQSEIQRGVQQAIQEERNNTWLKTNSDFKETMQYAKKLYEKDPEFAETILEMPDTFERQKLVYKSIKAMGLDKPEQKMPSIQEKVDANRKSPYYQPSGVGSSPYQSQSDYSPSGQKNAYDKMQELKSRLRI